MDRLARLRAMVPDSWVVCPLGMLALLERGKFSARPRNDPQYYGGDVPFVQTGDVTKAGMFLSTFTQTLNGRGAAVSKVFPVDCILMTIAANIGETAITTFAVACPDSIVAIQPFAETTDLLWLKYALEAKQQSLDAGAGKSAQKNINLQVLGPLELLTPPLEEQRRIGKVILAWDREAATLERLLANSRKQRTVLRAALLSGTWEPQRLGDIATFKNGLNFTAADQGEAIKIVGVSDFKHHTQLANTDGLSTIRASKQLRDDELLAAGDLLFVRSNGNKSLIGRCLFFPTVSERLAFSGFTIRSRVNPAVLLPSFAAHLMRSETVRDQILFAGGGTSISNVSQESLADISVQVPPLEEQKRIARMLDIFDRQVVVTERLLANNRKQKKMLMGDLLTGARRIPARAGRQRKA
jgi:type I restriction enzyme S subunit